MRALRWVAIVANILLILWMAASVMVWGGQDWLGLSVVCAAPVLSIVALSRR